MGNIKWVRVVLWGIAGLIIVIAAPILYVVVRMFMLAIQIAGPPPAEAQSEFASGTPILVVLFVAAALAGFLAGRGPARRAEGSYLLNGVLAGVLTAVLFMVYSLIGGGFDLILLLIAAVIIGLAAFGAWVGGRAAEAEEYD